MAQNKQYGSNVKYIFDLNTGNECHIKVLCIWKKIIFLWILNFNKHFILCISLANEKNMGKITRGMSCIKTLYMIL